MTPRQTYEERVARFSAEHVRAAQASQRLSLLRLITFVLFLAESWLAASLALRWLWGAVIVTLVTFVVLVVRHARVRREEQRLEALEQLNKEGLFRLDRNWTQLKALPAQSDVRGHAYADDIDVFGSEALIQLLGRPGTRDGQTTLESWLLNGAEPHTIAERQQTVRELAGLNDWRDTMALYAARTATLKKEDLDAFLRWAEGEPWLARRPILRSAAWVLPAITWTLLLLDYWLPTTRWWLTSALLTLVFSLRMLPHVHRTFRAAFAREAMFKHYPELFETALDIPGANSALLKGLHKRLVSHNTSPTQALRRLERLMQLADLRLSSLHIPVQVFTLSDVHVMHALENWQRRHGSQVRDWLAALGEIEALAALATLAHDHPDWVFPDVAAGTDRVAAEALGHPLLPDDQRVNNSVALGPAQSLLFVTGSNMSGKSTLLRALGLNIVLAQAGAPVCARSLRLPPADLRTSIRVQDSLARGISYFMAELNRLKSIVDAATQPPSGRITVYLLDEILHGTNSAERRIAARRVLAHLLELGAIGAVTSHDLDLVQGSELEGRSHPVHFREHFRSVNGKSVMEFDYRLREGLAPSTNALKLLELAGLD